MLNNRKNLKVLGIAGSLRERSSSQVALDYSMRLLAGTGCATRTFDLCAANLPFCNGNPDEQARTCPGINGMRDSVAAAHALVLVTPEYHGGISGVLKNALDLLDTRQLGNKVVGVISVLGGMAGTNALNDLSRVLRCCHAWVIPEQIAVGRASSAFAGGQISDPGLKLRFEAFAESLARSAARLCDVDMASSDMQGPFANPPELWLTQSEGR